MNHKMVIDFLEGKLPNSFETLSRGTPFEVHFFHETLTIRTINRIICVPLDYFLNFFIEVQYLQSFMVSEYSETFNNVSYLLPIVLQFLKENEVGIEDYTPPYGGFKNGTNIENRQSQRQGIEKKHDLFPPKELYYSRPSKFNYKLFEKFKKSAYRSIPEQPENREFYKILIDESKKKISFRAVEKEPHSEAFLLDVYYATNRKYVGKKLIFSNNPDTKLNYGKVTISVPLNIHKSGSVERPFKMALIKFPENKKKHFVINEFNKADERPFFVELKERAKGRLLLFIHGFNMSFTEALYKSAQLKYDLKFDHPVVLFSWPSFSKIRSYVADKERALYASKYLCDLIHNLSKLGIDEVMVVAHSMGTFCLSEALDKFNSKQKLFQRLILAAADIQKEAFVNNYSDKLKSLFNEISLYVSKTDKALLASNFVNQSNRIGDVRNGVTVIDGIDTIDMTDADKGLFSINHSYLLNNNKALDDIYHFMINRLPAEKRRLKELFNEEFLRYWAIP